MGLFDVFKKKREVYLEKLNRGEELNVPLRVKSAKCAFEGDSGLR